MWRSAFNAAPSIRLVLLAEAPMFGPKETYFYNPAAGATGFFSYVDAESIVGKLPATSRIISGVRPRKVQMIERLTAAGFLVLDLFPYSLKPNFTGMNYRQLCGTPAYNCLFRDTTKLHLIPKLILIKEKIVGVPKFVFRYARVRDDIESDVRDILIQNGLMMNAGAIESIHKGRNVDRERLLKLLKER
jgi:hypothetical protein